MGDQRVEVDPDVLRRVADSQLSTAVANAEQAHRSFRAASSAADAALASATALGLTTASEWEDLRAEFDTVLGTSLERMTDAAEGLRGVGQAYADAEQDAVRRLQSFE